MCWFELGLDDLQAHRTLMCAVVYDRCHGKTGVKTSTQLAALMNAAAAVSEAQVGRTSSRCLANCAMQLILPWVPSNTARFISTCHTVSFHNLGVCVHATTNRVCVLGVVCRCTLVARSP